MPCVRMGKLALCTSGKLNHNCLPKVKRPAAQLPSLPQQDPPHLEGLQVRGTARERLLVAGQVRPGLRVHIQRIEARAVEPPHRAFAHLLQYSAFALMKCLKVAALHTVTLLQYYTRLT